MFFSITSCTTLHHDEKTTLKSIQCQIQPFEPTIKVLQDGLLLGDAVTALAQTIRVVIMAGRSPSTVNLAQVPQAVQALARPFLHAPRVHAGLRGRAGSHCQCRARAEFRLEADKQIA